MNLRNIAESTVGHRRGPAFMLRGLSVPATSDFYSAGHIALIVMTVRNLIFGYQQNIMKQS